MEYFFPSPQSNFRPSFTQHLPHIHFLYGKRFPYFSLSCSNFSLPFSNLPVYTRTISKTEISSIGGVLYKKDDISRAVLSQTKISTASACHLNKIKLALTIIIPLTE